MSGFAFEYFGLQVGLEWDDVDLDQPLGQLLLPIWRSDPYLKPSAVFRVSRDSQGELRLEGPADEPSRGARLGCDRVPGAALAFLPGLFVPGGSLCACRGGGAVVIPGRSYRPRRPSASFSAADVAARSPRLAEAEPRQSLLGAVAFGGGGADSVQRGSPVGTGDALLRRLRFGDAGQHDPGPDGAPTGFTLSGGGRYPLCRVERPARRRRRHSGSNSRSAAGM